MYQKSVFLWKEVFSVWNPNILPQIGGHFNASNPPSLPWKGVNFLKHPLEKGVVFNSQNYEGYPLLMALTLPEYVIMKLQNVDKLCDVSVQTAAPHDLSWKIYVIMACKYEIPSGSTPHNKYSSVHSIMANGWKTGNLCAQSWQNKDNSQRRT